MTMAQTLPVSSVISDDPAALAVRSDALAWPEKATALKVVDDATYGLAADWLKGIKALRNKIADVFDGHIRRAHEAHKALVKEKADAEAPLAIAETTLKRSLVDYQQEQERKRIAEEKRLAEIARQEAEKRQLEEAAALEAEALATDDAGMLAAAQEMVSAPVAAPVVTLPKATPTVAGLSYRDSYVVTGIDLKVLVKAAATDANLLAYLQADESAIGAVVRSTKGAMKIPGVTTDVKRIASAIGR